MSRGDDFIRATTSDLLAHVPECVFCNEPLTEDIVQRDVVEIARAICEHLGVTWELRERLLDLNVYDGVPCAKEAATAFATLLEAAGIPRDGGTT